MRKRVMFTLIGLVLLTDLARHESGLLVHLLALPAALLLFPVAVFALIMVLASPVVYGVCGWLLWRRLRDGQLPDWTRNAMQRLRSIRPWGYRIRLEKVGSAQPAAPN